MNGERPLAVVFFQTEADHEPVRSWLQELPKEERKAIVCKRMNKNKHRGTNFRDFLEEDGLLEEVEARALKRAIALQLAKLIEQKSLSKADLALRMKTSRAAVDRMLDGANSSMTLATLEKAALALGQRIKLELVPA